MTHHAIHTHGHAGAASTGLLRKLPTEHERVIAQAQKWVAQTFFGTLMKQLREDPFRSKLMDGGRGGEAFGSLYDQRLVEHMSRSVGRKLTGAIAKRIEAKNAYARSAGAKEKTIATPRGSRTLERRSHVPTALRA